jgi:hypothetical protein
MGTFIHAKAAKTAPCAARHAGSIPDIPGMAQQCRVPFLGALVQDVFGTGH